MPNRTAAPKKTTTARGYGSNHKRARARLITRHIDGRRCSWCRKPMYKDPAKNWDGKPLEAHHPEGNPTRNTANELLHSTCNRQCGDPTLARIPPAATDGHTPPAETTTALGQLVMAWP